VRERFHTNSIRFRITVATAGIAVLLVIILIFCFVYSSGMIRSQVYSTYQTILATHIHGLTNDLDALESFLISSITDNEDLELISKADSRWSLAAYRQQKNLADGIITSSLVDGLFIYAPESGLWIDSTVGNYDNNHRRAVRSYISGHIEESGVYQQLKSWGVVRVGEEYVIFRILKNRGCYVGAWILASTITEDFVLGDLSHEGWVLISGGPDAHYDAGAEALVLDPAAASQHYQVESGYMAAAQKCEKLGAYLVILLKDDTITRDLDRFIVLMAILAVCALIAVAALTFASYRFLVRPLRKLSQAMQQFQKGDWDIRLPEQTELDEFGDINATFNHMVEQVEILKIDVYEQKTEKLQIENQMLKQQMAPHTLINCLNTIHGLAGSGKPELVQKMAEDLGKHLRYLLSGNQTVQLWQELDHARNYVEICNIRYSNGICLNEELDPHLLHARIPPLMIYGFVENSVKYALNPDKSTLIGLKIWQEDKKLRIQMWDNGPGYSDEMLQKLAAPRPLQATSGYRVGLMNLVRRTQLLYEDAGSYVRFYNAPEGGAYMDVCVPFRTTEGWLQ